MSEGAENNPRDAEGTEGRKIRDPVRMDYINSITKQIIDAGMEVHKTIGPGLLESIYEDCMAIELCSRGINIERQVPVPVVYKGQNARQPFRLDLMVEGEVIVELKAIERVMPIHQAQLLTYLRLTGCTVGLILNFNSVLFKDGIKRMIQDFDR